MKKPEVNDRIVSETHNGMVVKVMENETGLRWDDGRLQIVPTDSINWDDGFWVVTD